MILFPVASGFTRGNLSQPLLMHNRAPLAVSGSNIYTAWTNASATLHGIAGFFTKSNDGGKTFGNTMVLSPSNTNPKISVIRANVSIGASGNNVAVTWWTKKSGVKGEQYFG